MYCNLRDDGNVECRVISDSGRKSGQVEEYQVILAVRFPLPDIRAEARRDSHRRFSS